MSSMSWQQFFSFMKTTPTAITTHPSSQLDSLEKLDKLIDACRIVGIETTPMLIGALGIIPLFSWYHESFDKEEEITGIRIPPLVMEDHHMRCSCSISISCSTHLIVSNLRWLKIIRHVRTFMRVNGLENFRTKTLPLLFTLMC